jgi:hypothetical protein
MMTTTTMSIEQSLSQNSINNLTENSFEAFSHVLDDVELDLEGIFLKEFQQGLPADIVIGF